jgi:hypothetical protein
MTWREKAVTMYRERPVDKKPPWKSWARKFSVEFGENVTADALRGVCRRAGRGDTLQRAKNPSAGLQGNQDEPADISAEIDREKQKILEKVEKARVQKAINEIAQRDILADKMVAAITALPPLVIKPIQIKVKTNYREQVMVLQFSDAQYGTYISKESTNGLNEYNKDIAKLQFAKLLQSIISVVVQQRHSTPIRRLVIQFLGDNVEGCDIFIGQAHHVDLDAMQQVFELADMIVEFLVNLLQVFEEIDCYCLGGNHGRIGKKGENPHHVNLDYYLYKYLEAKLQNFKQIKWHITQSWWLTHEIFNWRFLMLHGDDIKGWNGLPYYGIDRADAKYTMLLAAKKQMIYHYLCLGHFHSATQLDRPIGEKIINGCWPGGSILALKALVTSSQPSQNLFGVHEEHGITWRFKLNLEVS